MMEQKAQIREELSLEKITAVAIGHRIETQFRLEKWRGKVEGEPYEVREFEGNVALNEGLNELWSLAVGATSPVAAYNAANARIGVGNDNTAAVATQTGLIGTAAYDAMMATFPTYGTSQQIVFKAEFDVGDANFEWKEVTVDNGNTRNMNLFRKVPSPSLGTKTNTEIWRLQVTLTLT